MREPLPASLARLDAKELRDFLRRALRENNVSEAIRVKEEYDYRGVRLSQPDYGKLARLKAEKARK